MNIVFFVEEVCAKLTEMIFECQVVGIVNLGRFPFLGLSISMEEGVLRRREEKSLAPELYEYEKMWQVLRMLDMF